MNVKKTSCWNLDRAFHKLVEANVLTLFLIACLTYAFLVVDFALLYLYVDIHYPCVLNIYRRGHWLKSFLGACYFSLETVLTIGYGTTDEFFGGCTSPLILIFTQAMISILIDSCMFGVIFAKFSRGQPRALSVAVSKHCIVRNIRGHWYLMFRVCETRTEQLCEAHVRIYAVRNERDEDGTLYECNPIPMRTQFPDDELGADLLMNVPSLVVHRLDSWSPLLPPVKTNTTSSKDHDASETYAFPTDIPQRDGDVDAGARDGKTLSYVPTKESIQKYLQDASVEILVLVEGYDPNTSCNVQRNASYTSSDIQWNHKFVPCVSRTNNEVVVDMEAFHKTMKINL